MDSADSGVDSLGGIQLGGEAFTLSDVGRLDVEGRSTEASISASTTETTLTSPCTDVTAEVRQGNVYYVYKL